MKRLRLAVRGLVQGVGFRPFAYHLASHLGLFGWVSNSNEGVLIEIQGSPEQLQKFITSLQSDKPEISSIDDVKISPVPTTNETGFIIKKSDSQSYPDAIVLPDLATCPACLKEILDPKNRRYRYPFTNCTYCGPRYSIIEKLPYDRDGTTMQAFAMCSACKKEYEDPEDRRFHAQPNACPVCGPRLALWDGEGNVLFTQNQSLVAACEKIREGDIIALKGIGGFQLIANTASIEILRQRKARSEKPFALMAPHIEWVKKHCKLSPMEEELLLSPAAPIVLLKNKKPPQPPENPYIGVMLPYSPLHHLMLRELNMPVVATSGNRSDEPICTDEFEALSDLKGIADYFLVHNRPISRAIDDSLVRVTSGRKLVLRRARGFSSIPIRIEKKLPPSLAVGSHLKNTVAAARDHTIYVSQHLGDLENQKALDGFSKTVEQLLGFYQIDPEIVVTDCHPNYNSTPFAAKLQKPLRSCQHHTAHIYSCMAENNLSPPLLGVSWDGTGYGLDKSIWGGEFFIIHENYSCERAAHIRPFPLPCGDKAAREPRLSAVGILCELFGSDLFEKKELNPIQSFTENEIHNLKRMFSSGFQLHRCSSMGRLFDAVGSLIGLKQTISFEGQAAMELEFCAEVSKTEDKYHADRDWEMMIRQILHDIHLSKSRNEIAKKFHNTLAAMIVNTALEFDQKKVVLSGGVFQNKVLTEKTVSLLQENQFNPYWHRDIPPNDGGISVGQLYSIACV